MKFLSDGNKSVIAYLIIPLAVFLAIIIIMLSSFSTKSSRDAKDTTAKNLLDATEDYGEQFVNELKKLQMVAKPLLQLAVENSGDATYAQNLLRVARDNSDAYKVYLCDADGEGIDHNGTSISVGEEDFFQQFTSSDDIQFIYTQDESSESKASVVSSLSMKTEQGTTYMFMFYPIEKFRSIFSVSDFDSSTFLALVDGKGSVMVSCGVDSVFTRSGNIIESVKKSDATLAKTLANRIENGTRGTSAVSIAHEQRVLVYVPVGINQWEMILGATQKYVDRRVAQQWVNARTILIELVVVLFAFVSTVIIVSIISKIRNNENKKKLEDKADTDLLTGLNNKLATERKIKEYIRQNPETQSMMFLLDVDNFKKINDTMGHAFGDEVLRSLGEQIPVIFRATDIIGRIGGDEFMIFLKDIESDEVIRKEAKKVETFFRGFQAGQYVKYAATASIGVAIFPHEGKDFETLYKAADQGLYKAKKRGKNQLAFYRDEWATGNPVTDQTAEDEKKALINE